jgi:hypothetical protein
MSLFGKNTCAATNQNSITAYKNILLNTYLRIHSLLRKNTAHSVRIGLLNMQMLEQLVASSVLLAG